MRPITELHDEALAEPDPDIAKRLGLADLHVYNAGWYAAAAVINGASKAQVIAQVEKAIRETQARVRLTDAGMRLVGR